MNHTREHWHTRVSSSLIPLAPWAAFFVVVVGFLNDLVLFPVLYPIGQRNPDLTAVFQMLDGVLVALIAFALVPVALDLRERAVSHPDLGRVALGVGLVAALARGLLFISLAIGATSLGPLEPIDAVLSLGVASWIVLASLSIRGGQTLLSTLSGLGVLVGGAFAVGQILRVLGLPPVGWIAVISYVGTHIWFIVVGWMLLRMPRSTPVPSGG